ncbi:VPLPA-CTERM sorting domain-containing protein [Paenirhodobacter populi]|uniref:VPLPA-CTERM sorting domain-containing protein n=1 Tax=Paenirhodobacter populi TaxID=2306993 RepID=A0A443IP86_9RHOB|nr:VPLPA-CTERM sorting domain-containing protein [Sinirhodobacter populi]RWR08158.1 VPLPA-CTERM sorting domain-containing protein [Sinirhodobacter populi]
MSIKTYLAATAVALLPVAASAATINEGGNGDYYLNQSYSETWVTGGQTWKITNFDFAAAAGAAFLAVYVDGISYAWENIGVGTTNTLSIPDFTVSDSFSIFVDYLGNGSGPQFALGTYSFTANVVPVPAAGVLLLSALAGLGIAARRNKKA